MRTVELNAKDPISSARLSVLCLSYIIISSSFLHCDDNFQCLNFRRYCKSQMMIRNNVFPVERPQNTNDHISAEITCVPSKLKMSSACEGKLLLDNCLSARDGI